MVKQGAGCCGDVCCHKLRPQSVWSQGNPSAQVLTKIKSFARASAATLCAYLECRSNSGGSGGLKTLFQTPTNQFDVLIHLRNEVIPAVLMLSTFRTRRPPLPSKLVRWLCPPPGQNLQDTTDFENQVLSGFSPPARYVKNYRCVNIPRTLKTCTRVALESAHVATMLCTCRSILRRLQSCTTTVWVDDASVCRGCRWHAFRTVVAVD